MADDEIAVVVAEVHAAAAAVFPPSAGGAFAGFHPRVVAVGLEAVFPHIHEIVLVDVALMIIGADAGAGRYGPVAEHPANRDAGLAEEEIVPHVAFVVAKEALAAVTGFYAALLPGGLDEVQ